MKKLLTLLLFINYSAFAQKKINWESHSVFDSSLIFEGKLLAKREYLATVGHLYLIKYNHNYLIIK